MAAEDETCAICYNKLNGICLTCEATGDVEPTTCVVVRGACGHTYHGHCIQRWLRSRATCPLDDTEWLEWTDVPIAKDVPAAAEAIDNMAPSKKEECGICMSAPVEIVFVPCGHIITCQKCAAGLTKCPYCRSVVQLAQRFIMAVK